MATGRECRDATIRHLRRPFGFRPTVIIRAVRGRSDDLPPVDEDPIHLFLNDDGVAVRRPMVPIIVRSELRGWWCIHQDRVAFAWPLQASQPPFTRLGGCSYATIELKIGQRFWRNHDLSFNSRDLTYGDRDELVSLVGFDYETNSVILSTTTETSDDALVTRVVDSLPINKFLADFDVNVHYRANAHNKWKLASYTGAAQRTVVPNEPVLPWAFTLGTVLKIRRAWRKVHMRAEEKKFSPGGVGAKRAREEFEGLANV